MALTAAELKVLIGADTSGAERGMDSVNQRLSSVGQQAFSAGAALTAGVTLPLAAVAKAALSTAMDYQSSMNMFQAVSGATAEQMKAVGAQATALGADMGLPATSAADAAIAMTELAKGGLDVEQSMAAAKGVLELVAAGEISTADAAKITVGALNAFHLAGDQATHVADLLAAAANASASDVQGLGLGLQMSASVFSMTGQNVESLVTALAEMSNAGIQGSDAGTSLKQMMLSLAAPSTAAAKEMLALGLNVYDAHGKMLPMRDIIGQFSEKLGGLTEQQRNAALATIFGSDAVRAANVVLMGGVQAWDELHGQVTREGAAADLAGARMKGLGGALEGLMSQVETVGLQLAGPFLDGLEGIVRGAADLVPVLGTLDPNLVNAGVAFAAVLAAAGPLIMGFGLLASGVAFLATPLGAVVLAVAAGAAVLTQFGSVIHGWVIPALQAFMAGDYHEGFKQLSAAAAVGWELVKSAFSDALAWVGDNAGALIGQLAAWGEALVEWVGPQVPVLLGELGTLLEQALTWIGQNAGTLIGQLASWGLAFIEWVAPYVPPLLEALQGLALSLLDWALQQVGPIVNQLVAWGTAFVDWVAPQIPVLLAETLHLASNLLDWIAAEAPTLVQRFLGEWAPAAIGWVAHAAIMLLKELPSIITTLVGWIAEAAPKVLNLFLDIGAAIVNGIIQGVGNLAGQLRDAIWNMATGALQAAKDALGIHSPSTVFAEVGQNIGEGIVQGVQGSETNVLAAIEAIANNAWDRADAINEKRTQESADKLAQKTSAQFNDILISESKNSQIAAALTSQQANLAFGQGQLANLGFDASGLGSVAATNQAVLALAGGGNTASPQNDAALRATALWVRDFMGHFAPTDVPDLATGKIAQFVLDEHLLPLIQGGMFTLAQLANLVQPTNGYEFLGKSAGDLQDLMFLQGLTSSLPGFADGVTGFGGGLAVVGERGPEIAFLPRGTSVFPHGSGPALGSTVNVYVTVQGSVKTEQELLAAIRRGLLQVGQRNGSVGLA